ncbi:MAG: N-acetyl-gamma-glutamyl-phosphate reductase, partial [Thiohalocapsa sp.]
MASIGIVGGTGYTGSELLRLLSGHPHVEVRVITSRAEAGQRVADALPMLRGRTELVFADPADAPLADCDLVFFATPNGTAMAQAQALLDEG